MSAPRKRIEITDVQLSEDLNDIANSDEDAATSKIDELRAKYLLERTEYLGKLAEDGTVADNLGLDVQPGFAQLANPGPKAEATKHI